MPVEDLPGEEPAENLRRAVGIVEDRPLVVLGASRPLRIADQRHEDPRRDEEGAAGHERCAANSPEEARLAGDDHPNPYREQCQVARDEVAGDRQRERCGRGRVALAAGHRVPCHAPRDRQQPHGPELPVDTVSLPGVAAVLVAVPRRADEQRRNCGSSSRSPRAPVQEPRAQVHGDRPEREEQVEDPEVDGLIACAEHVRQERRQCVRKALVVVKER